MIVSSNFNNFLIVMCLAFFSVGVGFAGTTPPPAPDPGPQPPADLGGDTPNNINVGTSLLSTCTTGANGTSNSQASQLFQSDCNDMVNSATGGDSGVNGALSGITSDEISALNNNSITSSGSALFARLSELRVASARPANLMYAAVDSYANDGNASADDLVKNLGFFINGQYSFQDHDDNNFEPGFRLDDRKITAGVDYRFTDNLVLGVSAGWVDSDADIDRNGGRIETAGYQVALYGSYYVHDQFYIDVLGGYSDREHDIHRTLIYSLPTVGANVNNQANSDPSSDNYFASLGTGYEFVKGPLTIIPTVRVDFTQMEIEGYTEKMSSPGTSGGAFNLRVKGEDFQSLTSNIGAQGSYAISRSWGVLMPQVSAEWVHQFEDESRDIVATFINDVNQIPFIIQTKSPDTDWFRVGAGISAQFAHNISAYLSYEKVLGFTDLSSDTLYIGMRISID